MGDKLLISLNIADLLICILSFANLLFLNEFLIVMKAEENCETWQSLGFNWQLYGMGPLLSLGLLTCFLTLMLCSTRTLAVVKPFYRIKNQMVVLAFFVFFIFLATLFIAKSFILIQIRNGDAKFALLSVRISLLELGLIFVTVVVVAILSGISIRVLKSAIVEQQQSDRHRKATIMIITLSIAFVVCNTVWAVGNTFINAQFLGKSEGRQSESKNVTEQTKCGMQEENYNDTYLSLLLTLIMITLNSCVNPIVYITKNSALNTYTKLQVRQIIDYFSNNTNSEARDVELNTLSQTIEEN